MPNTKRIKIVLGVAIHCQLPEIIMLEMSPYLKKVRCTPFEWDKPFPISLKCVLICRQTLSEKLAMIYEKSAMMYIMFKVELLIKKWTRGNITWCICICELMNVWGVKWFRTLKFFLQHSWCEVSHTKTCVESVRFAREEDQRHS